MYDRLNDIIRNLPDRRRRWLDWSSRLLQRLGHGRDRRLDSGRRRRGRASRSDNGLHDLLHRLSDGQRYLVYRLNRQG
jgi:hypothetical protein